MKVIRAETAGFCMGVQLALNKLDSLIENAGKTPLCTLGPIIHNPQVLQDYAAKGVTTADDDETISDDAAVVIRAHGVPRRIEEGLRQRGVRIVDATCPKVKKAQVLIGRRAQEGRHLLLFGEESHPEVKGLLSYADNGAFVFDDPAQLEDFPFRPDEKYCLASQTTQDRNAFEKLAAELEAREDLDVSVLNTVCDATRLRQQEVHRIAREVDFMVVAGGYNSGNTRRLAKVAEDHGIPGLHVETAADLPLERLRDYERIGLTAGASTPKQIIDEIEALLRTL